jgi:hypothetical protein
MFNDLGEETTDSALAVAYTFAVKLQNVIEGFSTNAVTVKKVSTESTFEIIAPNKGGIQSTPPISGYYQITCQDHTGIDHTSSDIKFDTNPIWITRAISESIPFLADKVEALYDYKYSTYVNGVSFQLLFTGLDYD